MIRIINIIFITLGLFGLTFAGWHTASEIVPGTFPIGNFAFDGSIKIGNDAAPCIATKEGTIRYNTTINDLQLCDGTTWTDVSTVATELWSLTEGNLSYTSGDVAIGTTNTNNYILSMVGDGIIDPDMHVYAYSEDSTNAKADYELFRARGTEASPLVVVVSDSIGSFRWQVHDGTSFNSVAQIEATIQGTPGVGDLPSRISFRLSADGEANGLGKMYIFQNGYVGIGTATAGDKLEVVGDIDATGCIQTDNSGSIGGTCLSDIRLKENIVPLNNSLNKITQLRPVSFDWKKDYYNISHEKGRSIGLIAQELEQVFPELVKTQADGYKKIRYDIELEMYMIAAAKEQQKQIEDLKSVVCINHPELDICH